MLQRQGFVLCRTSQSMGLKRCSGLHLPRPVLRLVSKRWKAMADSCADYVNVSLTGAAWPDWLEWRDPFGGDIGQPCAQAAFSRLCYAL